MPKIQASAVAMAIAVSLTPAGAVANDTLIVFDISKSAAITVEQSMADRASTSVQRKVSRLDNGDKVMVRSLGSPALAEQSIYINMTLSQKLRPAKAAEVLATVTRDLPAYVQDDKIKLQPTTNIIGFVESIAPSLKCSDSQAHLIFYSDGIEASNHVDPEALIAGTTTLPAPSGPILEGCSVEMLGLGQLHSGLASDGTWLPILAREWKAFFAAAGVQDFQAFAYFNN